MKNVTPRRIKTKPCELCGARVAKENEGVVVARFVTCVTCIETAERFDAAKADEAAQKIATKHGIALAPFTFAQRCAAEPV